MRSSLSYPYQTLVLNVRKTILPKSESRGHSITCRIYDETGETDNGIAYTQHEFPLDTLSLSQNDSIHIAVTHLMRQWQIHGISDIGISLTRR